MLADVAWPAFDPALVIDDVLTIAVQVNGKTRGTIELPRDAEKDAPRRRRWNCRVWCGRLPERHRSGWSSCLTGSSTLLAEEPVGAEPTRRRRRTSRPFLPCLGCGFAALWRAGAERRSRSSFIEIGPIADRTGQLLRIALEERLSPAAARRCRATCLRLFEVSPGPISSFSGMLRQPVRNSGLMRAGCSRIWDECATPPGRPSKQRRSTSLKASSPPSARRTRAAAGGHRDRMIFVCALASTLIGVGPASVRGSAGRQGAA